LQSDAQSDAQWLMHHWHKLPCATRRSIMAVARDALGAFGPFAGENLARDVHS